MSTPITAFRIPIKLKMRATATAAAEGRTLTAVVVDALERYAGDTSENVLAECRPLVVA